MLVILTCEHAVNTIPLPFQAYYADYAALLDSHQGFDFGAVEAAKYLSQRLQAPFFAATASRLLIDCNRSLSNPNCFSPISRYFPDALKKQAIEGYYLPYRLAVERFIDQYIKTGTIVLHLSMHTFTPELRGSVRTADLGLLYDPKRSKELAFACQWQELLKHQFPLLRVKRNYPYQGKSDGLTTALRMFYEESIYLGFEVEINQALVLEQEVFEGVKEGLARSLLAFL